MDVVMFVIRYQTLHRQSHSLTTELSYSSVIGITNDEIVASSLSNFRSLSTDFSGFFKLDFTRNEQLSLILNFNFLLQP